MLVPLVAAALASGGMTQVVGFDGVGGCAQGRPIATAPLYPCNMVDDVRRPGFNGRTWVDRPILGAIQQGPYPAAGVCPGPEAYGAFDTPDAVVYARVGLLHVEINAWDQIRPQGLYQLEDARQFWLKEQGYTGGVRTMVNDANLWLRQPAPAEQRAEAGGKPLPRATITLPADMPPQHRRLRVDSKGVQNAPVRLPGDGPARISWPDTASGDAVARTDAHGGLVAGAEGRVITQALPR
jgi:hypothetical protein